MQKYCRRRYDIIAINFDNPRYGNAWNPLKVPYELYKEGFKDKAIKALEDIGYYLFFDSKEKESDPFWINSTINYFVGLSLYLFDNAIVTWRTTNIKTPNKSKSKDPTNSA